MGIISGTKGVPLNCLQGCGNIPENMLKYQYTLIERSP